MKLYTECHWEGWDRIVNIYPYRGGSLPDRRKHITPAAPSEPSKATPTPALPEYINDNTTYKIIILEKGILEITGRKNTREVRAPALIGLTEKDVLEYRIVKDIRALTVFFKPTVIRDEFTYERIASGEFEKTMGQAVYQDYILIKYMQDEPDVCARVIPLSMNGMKRLKDIFEAMEKELTDQADGYWPCRSRSYLMEMLHFIIYSYIEAAPGSGALTGDPQGQSEKDEFSKITVYLNEHIGDRITLGTLTREFAVNRNKLNGLFVKHASMTCMAYLLNLRIDLAKILLTKTELPVNEISARVGYPDANYFAKLFRQETGMTPSQYRKS